MMPWARLRALLARPEPPAPSVDEARAVRQQAVEAMAAARSAAPRRVPVWALAAAVVVVALMLAWLRPGTPGALTVTVGPDGHPLEVGSYVAGHGVPVSLGFSDGSRVAVAAGARARVSEARPTGAVVSLEAGELDVEVVHRDGARWAFLAGPFRVRVVGTAFRLRWDPAGSLDVTMRDGEVVVSGPGIDGGVSVRTAARFTTALSAQVAPGPAAPGSALLPAADIPGGASPAPREGEPPEGAQRAGLAVSASAAPPSTAAPSPSPSALAGPAGPAPDQPGQPAAAAVATLVELVARGEYAAAMAEAERRGLDATLASAGSAELAALGDAARFTGRGAVAQRALLAQRARFPGSPRAASAAFLLGRSADDAGNAAAALGWLDAYLVEAPGGAFVGEALGRRLLVLSRLGRRAEAGVAARDYLRRFPQGAYAATARELAEP